MAFKYHSSMLIQLRIVFSMARMPKEQYEIHGKRKKIKGNKAISMLYYQLLIMMAG